MTTMNGNVATAFLLLLVAQSPVLAQRLTGRSPTGTVPAPVVSDRHDQFEGRFASVGDDVLIAGQPTEGALHAMQKAGVTTVVSLRAPSETKDLPYDEAKLVASLGMKYVNLYDSNPYTPFVLDRFAAEIADAKGKVLLHCTVAWRASHLWAAYLIGKRDVPVAVAIAQTHGINLMDTMGGKSRQPVEGFLNRDLKELHK